MRYYVYKLIDPRDDTIFYVGKGQKNRMFHHEKEAIKGVYSRKCARIREIIESGFKITYEIDSRYVYEKDAYSREKDLIEKIGLDNLTNVVAGGGGVMPVKAKKETWLDVKPTFLALSDLMQKHARGYKVFLGNLDLVEMAKEYISNLVVKYGFDKVSKEFKKYNIEVHYGSA